MNDDDLYRRLLNICGHKNVSKDPKLLGTFSEDLSFVPKKNPKFIVWLFNTNIVEKLLKEANSSGFSVIPISSPSVVRYHGDTIPKKDNTIIINLTKMNQVLSTRFKRNFSQ